MLNALSTVMAHVPRSLRTVTEYFCNGETKISHIVCVLYALFIGFFYYFNLKIIVETSFFSV